MTPQEPQYIVYNVTCNVGIEPYKRDPFLKDGYTSLGLEAVPTINNHITDLEIAGAKLQNNVHLCLSKCSPRLKCLPTDLLSAHHRKPLFIGPTYTCLPQKSLKGIILMDCKTIGSLNMSNRLDHSTIAFPT